MDASRYAPFAALTHSIRTDVDFPILMQRAVTCVAETLAIANSAIWELCSDGSTLVFVAGVGYPESAVRQSTIPLEAVTCRSQELTSRAPVITVDWHAVPAFDRPALLRAQGITRSLYVCVQAQGHPYTLLSVDIAVSRTVTDEEIAYLQVAADLLALAMERVDSDQVSSQSRKRVAENVRHIVSVRDSAILQERRRLARELHDCVTQALYSVTLHAVAATRLLAAGDLATAADNVRVLQDTAQEVLDEMRLLIFELRHPLLEQVGLVAALQARLNAVEGRANLETQLIVGELSDLPSVVEEALYRIAQEALNNALRHAHARHITMQLRQVQSRLILEISDDGVGFDVVAARAAGGFGLCGIAERVAQHNGRLTLNSSPGTGTHLRVEIAV